MSDTADWEDETTDTGAKMADEEPAPVPEGEAPEGEPTSSEDTKFEDAAPAEEAKDPQVRITQSGVDSFVVPDLGGLSIGRQWHSVSADQLERIQDAARMSGVAIEVKEDPQDAE